MNSIVSPYPYQPKPLSVVRLFRIFSVRLRLLRASVVNLLRVLRPLRREPRAAQNPNRAPNSIFRAGAADVGSPKNGDVITPL